MWVKYRLHDKFSLPKFGPNASINVIDEEWASAFFTGLQENADYAERVVQSEKAAVGVIKWLALCPSVWAKVSFSFISFLPTSALLERAPPKLAIFWEHILFERNCITQNSPSLLRALLIDYLILRFVVGTCLCSYLSSSHTWVQYSKCLMRFSCETSLANIWSPCV